MGTLLSCETVIVKNMGFGGRQSLLCNLGPSIELLEFPFSHPQIDNNRHSPSSQGHGGNKGDGAGEADLDLQ